MLKAQATIESDRFLSELSRAVDRFRDELAQRLRKETEFRKAELRQFISKYVYQAYKPVTYTRREDVPLIRVVEGVVRDGKTFVEFILYNDSSQFQTQRRTGGAVGGTAKWEVPWEIEEGRYPAEMKAAAPGKWSEPRPAYALYTRQLDKEIGPWTSAVFEDIFTRLA